MVSIVAKSLSSAASRVIECDADGLPARYLRSCPSPLPASTPSHPTTPSTHALNN